MTRTNELIASWLIVAMAATPESFAAAGAASFQSEITAREQSMNAALAANDPDTYFAFFAQDMSGIFYDQVTTLPAYRQTWSDAFAAGRRIRSVKLGDISVRMLPGSTAAVAHFVVDVTIDHPDGDISTEHAFQSDVWVKRKGGWQLLHTHFAVATPAAH